MDVDVMVEASTKAGVEVFHPQSRCAGAVHIKRLVGIEAGCEKGPTEAQNRAVAFANRAERLATVRGDRFHRNGS